MRFLVTCPGGCSSILNQELKHLGFKPLDIFPTGAYVDGDLKDLYMLNLRCRVASKVFVQMGTWRAENFDQLFEGMKECHRSQRIGKEANITIHPVVYQSKLYALKSVQSSAHKAVLTALEIQEEINSDATQKVEISIHVVRDQASAYLNTSGAGLHQRGYRTQQGEAPLKENVAAALILSSGWRRGQLLVDPFCGSGTICIEAALIASNIAPGT
jgi:putative N6-adenine-specific DNA methylase